MPRPGHAWWHLILTAHGQWLPGDPRGFRDRAHRLHSSGDYKHRPPEGEHAGLHRYASRISGKPVVFPPDCRPRVGQAMVSKLEAMKARCLALAVTSTHAHLLVEMTDDTKTVRHQVGFIKQASSHAIRDVLPGKVWAEGGKPIRVLSPVHQRRVFAYILKHADEDAWIWRYDQDASSEYWGRET